MFPGVCYQLKVELTERSKPNRIRPIFQFLFPGVSKSTPQSIATTRHPEKWSMPMIHIYIYLYTYIHMVLKTYILLHVHMVGLRGVAIHVWWLN